MWNQKMILSRAVMKNHFKGGGMKNLFAGGAAAWGGGTTIFLERAGGSGDIGGLRIRDLEVSDSRRGPRGGNGEFFVAGSRRIRESGYRNNKND